MENQNFKKKIPAYVCSKPDGMNTNCSKKLLGNKIAQISLRRQIYRKNLRANVETREMREGRRWKYVAHLGVELDRKNKTESGSPSLALAGSWTADHTPK